MKRIKITFKKLSTSFQKYKFAIKTIHKGEEIMYWPLVKAPGLFQQWRPLVRVEDEVQVMDYETPGGLSLDSCYSRIEEFQEQLKLQEQTNIISCEINEVTKEDLESRRVDKW